jgi:hypothetical protein
MVVSMLVMSSSDGGAGELHGITAKLLEVMVWLEKGRGELSTGARSGGNGARPWRQRCVQEKKMRGSGRVKEGCSKRASSLNRQCLTAAARHRGRRQARAGGSGSGGAAWRARKRTAGKR